jgi:hypothetical protein
MPATPIDFRGNALHNAAMSASAPGDRLRASVLLTAVLAAALLVACGGGGEGDSGNQPGTDVPEDQVQAEPLGAVTEESAIEAVESFDPADEEAVASLNNIVYDGGDYVPSLEPLLDSEDPNVRWAALYVIANLTDTEDEIGVLTPILEDDEVIFSVMAAGSLAGLGVVDAIPALIRGLSSTAELPYSDPPQPLSSFALLTLEHYTGETFDDADDWQAWWDDVGSSIAWEDGQYVSD